MEPRWESERRPPGISWKDSSCWGGRCREECLGPAGCCFLWQKIPGSACPHRHAQPFQPSREPGFSLQVKDSVTMNLLQSGTFLPPSFPPTLPPPAFHIYPKLLFERSFEGTSFNFFPMICPPRVLEEPFLVFLFFSFLFFSFLFLFVCSW